jgi:hypothetical protein
LDLERRAIERNDFPTVDGGYDREAVDSHLRAIADAIERRRSRPRPGAAGRPSTPPDEEALEPDFAYADASAEDVFGGVDRSMAGMFGGRIEVPRRGFEAVDTPPAVELEDLPYEGAGAEDQFGPEDRSLKRGGNRR